MAFRLTRADAVRLQVLRPVRLVCWPATDRAEAIAAFVRQRQVRKMHLEPVQHAFQHLFLMDLI